MRSPVWIAGGTTEGRKLAHYADCCHIRAYVSVATDYGASLVPESPFVTVVTGRPDPTTVIESVQWNDGNPYVASQNYVYYRDEHLKDPIGAILAARF